MTILPISRHCSRLNQNFLWHNLIIILFCIFPCCKGRGVDAGGRDPLKLGLIDPLALEVGATYTLMVPLIIFTVGVLVIPTVMVILYLFVTPLLIYDRETGGGRSLLDNQLVQIPIHVGKRILESPECVYRISCEISAASRSSRGIWGNITEFLSRILNLRDGSKPHSSRAPRTARSDIEHNNQDYLCEEYSCNLRKLIS